MRDRKENEVQPSQEGSMEHPSILLIGEKSMVDEIGATLKHIHAKQTTSQWSRETAPETVAEHTAVILVSPLLNITMVQAIQKIRSHPTGENIPLFIIVPKTCGEHRISRFYKAGASAVFEWPTEAEILPHCMVNMIAVNFVHGHVTHPDSALARLARAHIQTKCRFHHQVRVRVVRGTALLCGSVNQYWQRNKIRDTVMDIPGLKAVVDRDVFVLPSGIPDDMLLSNIRRLLRDAQEFDEQTLAVRVENGRVILAGSIARRLELQRLMGLLSSLRGIRDISPFVVISAKQRKRDHRIAKRLQKKTHRISAGGEFQVAFFGKTAVLSGNVSSLGTKQRLQDLLEEESCVDRVVNKLQVTFEQRSDTSAKTIVQAPRTDIDTDTSSPDTPPPAVPLIGPRSEAPSAPRRSPPLKAPIQPPRIPYATFPIRRGRTRPAGPKHSGYPDSSPELPNGPPADPPD